MAKRNNGGGGNGKLTAAQQKVADDATYTIVQVMNDTRTRLAELGADVDADTPVAGYSPCRECDCREFLPLDGRTVVCQNSTGERCRHHMSAHVFY